ncbi:FkbM family methyltransferase [Desulfoluna butyratoxydans]|uniref:S-adenosyl-l-methionine-dependent methyltransferase n=1 Tax=Desulfoluna butyratoxydans TaxID=231438 RepID=A0A4U8YUI3_9BACT|nr:FkbM family methyltransferase [Desulfoluna butyratoxydans]VFQ45003.1 s-adenosyl-l-methionine-dependent methyltransferase [Desulfoluna butyratoxydans]
MSNSLLYKKTIKNGFSPSHVAEVGVWHPDTSNILRYIESGIKATLVEPDPDSINLIKKTFTLGNVTLHEVAVCDFDGEVELCKRESSTFVSFLPDSPAITNDNCIVQETEKFTVKAVRFNSIDDGSIDLLSVDTEGSEWFIIKNLISRPAIVSIETHGGIYTNPYIDQLTHWFKTNNYSLWYLDDCDSVYVNNGKVTVTLLDRMKLVCSKVRLKMKFTRKVVSKKIKRSVFANGGCQPGATIDSDSNPSEG